MFVIIKQGELGNDSPVIRSNLRTMVRCYLEDIRNVRTGLPEDGFSAYQISLLSTVAITLMTSKQKSDLYPAMLKVKERLDDILYGGALYFQRNDVYWDDNDLVIRRSKVH